ncbi:GAF domain-containing protein [uncultured Sphingomonas sp.]|uniref:GAF domain-containing protein n=1 Tax=uncultured Sphingomonas sp. TaxID=158754 RepID=UPI0025D4BA2C|nr:GAF domain-containing protein [uncultured Sphingomonas sp.]
MSRWVTAGGVSETSPQRSRVEDAGAQDLRIARVAVALLRGDVAVLQTGSRVVMAAAHGVAADEPARLLVKPLLALAKGYRSQLSVPIWRDERRVGALVVLGRGDRAFSDADVAVLRALAASVDRACRSLH